MEKQPITPALIQELAAHYGYEAAALRAIIAVETGGIGYDPATGQLLIQFEPAWFRRLLPKAIMATITAAQKAVSTQQATPAQVKLVQNWNVTQANGVESQRPERVAFNAAWAIHPNTAMLATSFGLGQTMGFNAQACGYPTAGDMIDAFKEGGEAEQLRAMCRFIASKPPLLAALRQKNWDRVAYYYNGAAYSKAGYHTKLAKAYARFAAGK